MIAVCQSLCRARRGFLPGLHQFLDEVPVLGASGFDKPDCNDRTRIRVAWYGLRESGARIVGMAKLPIEGARM